MWEALGTLFAFVGIAVIFDILFNEGDTIKAIFGKNNKP